MENPFELIMERLDKIEKAISNLKIENAIVLESKPMNLKEVSAYICTSTSAIYKLTSTSEIPHYKLGKKLYFKKKRQMNGFTRIKSKPDKTKKMKPMNIFLENEILLDKQNPLSLICIP